VVTNNTDADEDVALDPKIMKAVNQAVTSQLKRATGKLTDSLGTLLDEKLAAFKPAAGAPAPDKKDPAGGGAAAGPAADDGSKAELAQLRADLKAQKLRGLEKETYADVRAFLTGKVKPEALDTAVKLLKADGRIKLDMRTETASYKGDDGDVDVQTGISEWLKADGALFAAAPAPARPGARPALRAPARPNAGGGGAELTPAQKSAQQLAAKGLTLD
jgi:hypothetical protein